MLKCHIFFKPFPTNFSLRSWQQPPNFRGDLKISDQNNWGEGDLSKKLNLGGAKFKGGPKILGRPMNPNDVMVVVLKDILLCLLGFRFIYIV